MAERGNFFKKSKEEGGEKEVEMDKELTNREEAIEEELEAGEVFVLRRYFSRYFKVPTCSTLTYLYKIGDLEEDLYVPYPAVSAVLRGVWVRIRPYL
ncbi:hypothetical protein L249_8367 [Ophiocordyceps polyrhachis-furcata BCC 54312]|uniref:Uncharacterized protein n=1 Tax=Ophiocordyceps polyrhachis-furcata BCC 54312 TaxID=1330021 RepID=A0A367L1L7_9HYPO|nr:hypothetical protein L249_8368 [Ophiocordyceps polyrhachis-furcata BCC 54312]RCI08306.1 hypothetical protein L249_8367 [Ophiocordyceps polyrhachis-furcata BCC 54312]